MLELELGVGGIHAHREQAVRVDPRTRLGDVSVRLFTVAVLEDLDADDEPVAVITGEGSEVTVDEPIRLRGEVSELRDGDLGHIEPDQIETTGNHG